jgi:membrane dipeptidase
MLPRALAVYGMTTNVTSGMMVDLSHVSPEAAEQGLKCTDAPVMFSHSNARGVFDCPRNVPDSILDLVPANNGIVMVTFVPEHLTARRSEATMDMLLDHIFYIANRIGWEHVGLGSDFDGEYHLSVSSFQCRWYNDSGIASVIPGLEDCSTFPHLLKAILDRGATEQQLALVAGENILRVWTAVAQVSERMQEEGMTPVEDVWEGRQFWRYDGFYQMPDPDPEDKLGLDWYGVKPPEEGLYHDK